MKGKRFTEEQIIRVLKEAESGLQVTDLCRRQGISEATYYRWKSKYGGMEVSEAKRLRASQFSKGTPRVRLILRNTLRDKQEPPEYAAVSAWKLRL